LKVALLGSKKRAGSARVYLALVGRLEKFFRAAQQRQTRLRRRIGCACRIAGLELAVAMLADDLPA